MKIFLVGGAVRDNLLGIEAKDKDYVVVGSTIEEMKKNGYKQVGADFPVFLHPTTGEEYALARQERKTGTGYHGFETRFSPDITLEMDLARRDLTINSIAQDLETGEIIDPFNGQEDLKKGILKHTSDAFSEDPVRVLRIARFNARYSNFRIHQDTLKLLKKMIIDGEIDHLTPERIFAEFDKGLGEKDPGKMFKVLNQIKADERLMEWGGFKKPGVHSYHTIFTLDALKTEKLSKAEKFAIIAGAFTHTSFEKWKIPNEYKEISIIINEFSNSFRGYDDLRRSDRLGFLYRLNIFQSSEKAMSFCRVVEALAKAKGEQLKTKKFWADCIGVMTVKASDVAKEIKASGGGGKEIKEALFKKRMNALT